MQPLICILLLATLISCTSENKTKPVVLSQPVELPPKDSLENYSVTKQKIIAARDSLRRIYHSADGNRATVHRERSREPGSTGTDLTFDAVRPYSVVPTGGN